MPTGQPPCCSHRWPRALPGPMPHGPSLLWFEFTPGGGWGIDCREVGQRAVKPLWSKWHCLSCPYEHS